MQMNQRLVSGVILLMLGRPAWGQTADEFVALALKQNGELLAVRAQVAASLGGVTQARLRANPSVQVSGTAQAGGSDQSFLLGGTLPLELYGRRERRVEVAAAGLRVAEFSADEAERRLRGEVAMKFGEVLAAQRNLAVVMDLLEVNRKALGLMERRVEQGAEPALSASLLRVEINRNDSLRADHEGRLAVSLLELKSLAGLTPEAELQIRGNLEDEPEYEEQAVPARPDILMARAAESVAAARLRQAETEAKADGSVSASWQRTDSSFDVNGFNGAGQLRPVSDRFHYLTGGVSLNLPVRNKNQGAIGAARADIAAARYRREYQEAIAAREISAAVVSAQKAEESLKIYRTSVRDQAGRNLEIVRRSQELGRGTFLDVIAEQRRFLEIETGYTEALSRNYLAAVRLRTVRGK